MPNDISIRGHVTVVLVMNMRRFVEPADQKRFETLRGAKSLLDTLRTVWPVKIERQQAFSVAHHPLDDQSVASRMATDEVAFLSGIFRSSMLEDYSVPAYYLKDKSCVDFPEHVRDNLQFKNVFLEVWKYWDVYVRPTATGMFVISLRRKYERTTPLLRIASDVVSLQTAFDIPGANQRLSDLASKAEFGGRSVQEKKKSIEAFLSWLDIDQESKWQPQYAPVQWKLAMEVCRRLVLDAGMQLGADSNPIRLRVPDRTTSPPLHESFIIYHVDELIAIEPIVHKARATENEDRSAHELSLELGQSYIEEKPPIQKGQPKIHVTPQDIQKSDELRQQIVALLEGAVLRRLNVSEPKSAQPAARLARTASQPKGYFPEHRPRHVQETFSANVATWHDELCILTSRAALIMPVRYSRRDELLLSNFSSSTGKVMYLWYWEAMEHMFEFIVEVRVLTQLIERASSELLGEFEMELTNVRRGMSRRNIRVNYGVLTDKVERVANLSRLLGLGRSLTAPSVWGRAEFAVEKARLLLERQEVPILMQHAEKNVNSLNELVNHIDELYLADLSESNNRLSFYLSMLLAGLSLSVVVFAIISFWADAQELDPQSVAPAIIAWVPAIVQLGNVLSLILAILAIIIIGVGIVSFARDLANSFQARGRKR
jgi:hypothetical protein